MGGVYWTLNRRHLPLVRRRLASGTRSVWPIVRTWVFMTVPTSQLRLPSATCSHSGERQKFLAHAAACLIHDILREYLPAYREACCMDLDTLILADNVVPAVPEALVCVQWVAAPLEGIRSDSGIYPTVEAYVLLGVVADHAGVGRFANAPHLLKIHAITSADVSAMRRRCAKLRYALQRAGGC